MVGKVLPHLLQANLNCFSGGRLVMSFSVVLDILGWVITCCVLVSGTEMIIPARLFAWMSRLVRRLEVVSTFEPGSAQSYA